MRRRRAVLLGAAVAALGVIVWLYASYDPSGGRFPRCLFNAATGLRCPGCGSQRALHAVLGGDIAGAMRFNALFLPGMAACALFFVAEGVPRRFPRLSARLRSAAAAYTLLGVILGWWLLRNIAGL